MTAAPEAEQPQAPVLADAREAPARRRAREFGGSRRVPALIAAVVLAAVAALSAIEMISRLIGHRIAVLPVPAIARFARDTRFDDVSALVLAGVLAAAGLALLCAALWPSRGRVILLYGTDGNTVYAVTRAGLRRDLARAARAVDGITGSKVRIRRSRVRVRAASPFRDTSELGERVRGAVTARLAGFGPVKDRTVRVTVRRGKELT